VRDPHRIRPLLAAAGAPRGIAVDGDHLLRQADEPVGPGHETAPESHRIKHGKDVPEPIMARRIKRQLLLPESGDVGKPVRSGKHRDQAREQDPVEPIDHLALLARVPQILKMGEKNNRSIHIAYRIHRPLRSRESEAIHRLTASTIRLPLFSSDCPVDLDQINNFSSDR